eukprot:scaffold2835_cov374-Prasinococcus_capsulatus_cf.AAC.1
MNGGKLPQGWLLPGNVHEGGHRLHESVHVPPLLHPLLPVRSQEVEVLSVQHSQGRGARGLHLPREHFLRREPVEHAHGGLERPQDAGHLLLPVGQHVERADALGLELRRERIGPGRAHVRHARLAVGPMLRQGAALKELDQLARPHARRAAAVLGPDRGEEHHRRVGGRLRRQL